MTPEVEKHYREVIYPEMMRGIISALERCEAGLRRIEDRAAAAQPSEVYDLNECADGVWRMEGRNV